MQLGPSTLRFQNLSTGVQRLASSLSSGGTGTAVPSSPDCRSLFGVAVPAALNSLPASSHAWATVAQFALAVPVH